MKQKQFETEIHEAKSIPLVRRAGSVLGAGALAVLAVGAVGVYAFVGGSSIPHSEPADVAAVQDDSSDTYVAEADEESVSDESVSQVAVTWRKAGIEEYDIVVETVKATEKSKTTTKALEAKKSETTSSEKQTTTTKAAETTALQTNAPQVQTEEKQTEKPEATATVAEEEVKPCSVMSMVTNDKVNMRKAPSLDADIITVLPQGTEITVTGYTSDWYRIKYDGTTGYCMKRYAAEGKPSSEETASDDVISYTADEFDMLCCVLQGEVGDCSEDSKIAVANVIINRVKSSAFPDTIEGVLTQADQFTAIYKYYSGSVTPSQSTIDCAKRALGGEDNTKGAVYYYAPQYCGGSTAAWFETLTFCFELDGQRYFK